MAHQSFSESSESSAQGQSHVVSSRLTGSWHATADEILGEENAERVVDSEEFAWRSEFTPRTKPAASRLDSSSHRIGLGLLIGFPILFALLGGAIAGGFEHAAHANVLRARAEASAAGLPISFAEIPMPTVPDEQNAAPIYWQAQKLLVGPLNDPYTLVTKGWDSNAKAEDRTAAIAALPKLQPLFDLLAQLSSRRLCDFHRDWSKGPDLVLPEYAYMKGCVRILALRAELQDRHGDWKAALESLGTADRIGKDAAGDPILIGLLVRDACRMIVDREYEEMIGRHSHDRAFLAAIAPQLRAQTYVPDLRRVIGGEIAMSMAATRARSWESQTSDYDPRYDGPSLEQRIARSDAPFVRDSIDASFLRHSTQEWREMPTDPHDWQAIQVAMGHKEAAIEADHSAANYFAQEFSPTFLQSMDSVGLVQAHDRLLVASVRLLRARLETGKLPSYLPTSLGEFRLDPFDGGLLRYQPLKSGFKIYSIGQDRTDDGGRRRSPNDPGSQEHYDEVVEFR